MRLTYTNNAGESLLMAAPDGIADTPYYVTGLDGAHGLDMEINAIEQYPMDGAYLVGERAKPRTITIEGIIHSNQKAKDRVAMLEMMRPKETGMLTATRGDITRRTPCVVERAPYFNRARGDKFQLTLYCPWPYWEDAAGGRNIDLNQWEGLFEFELEIPTEGVLNVPDEELANAGVPEGTFGIEFGRRIGAAVVSVENPGDMASGFIARLTAQGTVVNPELIDVKNMLHMPFNAMLANGDFIEISTVFAQKYAIAVRTDGTQENAFKYIAPNFQFFQLEAGMNYIATNALEGAAFLNATLDFAPCYLGL